MTNLTNLDLGGRNFESQNDNHFVIRAEDGWGGWSILTLRTSKANKCRMDFGRPHSNIGPNMLVEKKPEEEEMIDIVIRHVYNAEVVD